MGSNGLPPKRESQAATSPPAPSGNRSEAKRQARQKDRRMSALVTLAMLGMAFDSDSGREESETEK
jgi:hypothetical protein